MAGGQHSRADNFARFFSVAEDRGITFEEAIVRTKDKKRGPLLSQPIAKNLSLRTSGPTRRGWATFR